MGAEFTFRYQPADEEQYEVAETSSDFFNSLFDADVELLKEGNLFPPFVQEYREQKGQTSLEEMESSTEEDIKETLAKIPEDPEEWDLDDMEWGPSTPFAPSQAKQWAQQWIDFVEEADDEMLAAVFPYTLNLQTGKSMLQKNYAIEDLRKVMAQADCAEQHTAHLIGFVLTYRDVLRFNSNVLDFFNTP